MTLLEHLGELRKRLVRGFLAILIGFFACYGFAQQLFYYLSLPLLKVMPNPLRKRRFPSGRLPSLRRPVWRREKPLQRAS